MFLRRAAEITAWQLEEQRIPDANTRASTYIEVTDTCFEGDDGRDRHAGQALRGYTTRRTEADERPAVRKLEEKLEKQQRGAGDTSVVVLCSGVELEPWPPWARGRCASGLYGRPRAHLSGYQRQATLRIGTSAFRLIDRARVPTNLRISRPGPHQVSHTSIQHHLSTTTNPPLLLFFSSTLRPQQPRCRTLLLARRSSLERVRGPFRTRARRPRSGTPWMTSRNQRKSVLPLSQRIDMRFPVNCAIVALVNGFSCWYPAAGVDGTWFDTGIRMILIYAHTYSYICSARRTTEEEREILTCVSPTTGSQGHPPSEDPG